MPSLKKIVCWLGYRSVAWWPPSFYTPFPWGKHARRFFARGLLEHCGRDVNIETGARFSSRDTRLGDHSAFGVRSSLDPHVTIGRHVMMAADVVILTSNHRFDDVDTPMMLQGYSEARPVVVEDDVWIGQRAIILPGVRIGKGSIIGAGAVVSRSVPPYPIAVGNPARVIRSRVEGDRPDAPDRAVAPGGGNP